MNSRFFNNFFSAGGADTSDATATAADILKGKTAYVNDVKVSGTIESKSAETYTPGTTNKTISAGVYLSGNQTIKGDSNLNSGNIKNGVSIFGVTGTLPEKIDTSDATATAADILKGKTAYVNDEKITGTKEADVQNVEFVEGKTYFATDDNISKYIETIRIPEGVTGIGNSSESNQSMFFRTKHIILPSTLKEIGNYAFSPTTYDRNSLISIFIPKSVTIIGKSAFLYCRGLEHIYYEGTEEEWNAITKGSGWNSYMGYDVSRGTTIHYNYVPE